MIAGRQAQAGRDPGPRPARPARARRQGRRDARGALRWSAPAPGHRPGAGQRAHAAAGRRAHRRPRQRRRPRGARAVPRLHDDGQTIVMVTHSQEVAAGADRIVRMRDGRIEPDGRRATLLAGRRSTAARCRRRSAVSSRRAGDEGPGVVSAANGRHRRLIARPRSGGGGPRCWVLRSLWLDERRVLTALVGAPHVARATSVATGRRCVSY